MSNPGPVLCPVDFSEQSREALRWAAIIAEHRGSELTVLSVVDPILAHAARVHFGDDPIAGGTEAALRDFVAETERDWPTRTSPVRVELLVGEPSDEIPQFAEEVGADLIVMGTHGLGGFQKFLLGSTTERVLSRTPCPLLAVPPAVRRAPRTDHPGVEVQRVLAATDFRESGTAAVQWARTLAADIRVPLILAHVVEPVVVLPWWQTLLEETEHDRVGAAERRLDGACTTGVGTECVVSVGHAAETIAGLATKHAAGVVVMGVEHGDHGHHGSTAYAVLRSGRVAVVVVPWPARATSPANEVGPAARVAT